MSEVEVRMALVGPTGKSLKFLNNKNNLAAMYLNKKMQIFEREKSLNMAQLDHSKIDALEFMKHVRKREPETHQARKWLDRSDFTPTPEPIKIKPRKEELQKAQRKRKVRLAQTAPARGHKVSGTDRSQGASSLDTDRKKSVYLQIAGVGKEQKSHVKYDDSDDEEPKRKELPKPSPRTMLDVMMGLNAFSHVPPPRCSTRSPDEFREDSRLSLQRSSSINSVYESTENIAEKFIQQWRKRIASRKQSIYDKLATESPKPDILQQRESVALSSVPEMDLSSSFARRKSKWTTPTRMSIRPSNLPVISQNEDMERRELFQAWVKDRKDEIKMTERPESPLNLTPQQRTAQRRKSFSFWMKKRNQQKVHAEDSDDEAQREVLKYTDPYEVDDGPPDVGDMMRTIINIKKKFKDPLDSRLKKFYKELDILKERNENAHRQLTDKERKRKWKMLMKGIDAALADSSDEEDNYFNTV